MRPECRDAVSALCDGEVVDPALVAEALADPGAAAYLVAIAETRTALAAEDEGPSAALDARMQAAFARLEADRVTPFRRWLPAGLERRLVLGTAAGLVAGLLLGFWVGPREPTPASPATAVASRPVEGGRDLAGALPPTDAAAAHTFEVGRTWQEGPGTP